MNNQTIQLAKSIAIRISTTAVESLSEIDKDILLEDIRILYKTVKAHDATSDEVSVSAASVQNVMARVQSENSNLLAEENAERKVEVQQPEPEAEPVTPEAPQVPLAEVVLREPETKVPDVAEPEKEELIVPSITVAEEKAPEPERKFAASVGIGGEVEPSTASINEAFRKDDASINTMATNVVRELHAVVASSSFSGLLDLNKRILFTKELFNENSESFNAFVQQMERCKSLEEAKSAVNTTALTKGWKTENDAVRLLVGLVRQHFEFR